MTNKRTPATSSTKVIRVARPGCFLISLAIALLWLGPTHSSSQSSGPGSAPPELVIQTGHSSRVNCAVFIPNQSWLASGSADNSIRLWDLNSGLELRALHGHKNWITALAVSRSGELLASGSNDRTVRVWSVSSGRELLTLTGHQAVVDAVLFSPDDRWVISGSADSTIRIWDATSGREVQTLKGHTAGVTALAMSDGKMLASGSADNSVRLWNTATWSSSLTLSKHTTKITSLTLSGDGRRLLSGSADGALILWDSVAGRARFIMKHSSAAVMASTFTDEKELLSVGADGTIVSWNAETGKEKRAVPGDSEAGEILFASLSNTRGLVASSNSRSIQVRNVSDGKLVRTLTSHAAGFFSVAFSGDGRWLAAGTNDRTVRLWQVANGREMPRLAGHTGWVNAVAFSSDSRLLASASNSGEVKLWDVNSRRQVHSELHNQERTHTLAFSQDGKWLAAAGTGQVVHLLEVVTKRTQDLPGHTGEITGLAFIPNSSWIASGSTDKTIKLWDLNTGKVVKTFGELTDQVNAISVSPDGSLLAAGTADKKVELFKLNGGERLTLIGHTSEIFALRFSRDGRLLASGGMDQTVRLWDAKTGAELRTLSGSSGEVNGLDFTSDSKSLISAHGDGSMIVWNIESGALAAILVSIPDSDDWLVTTPRGSFDGSNAAWKLLLWRFAQTTHKVAPVELFFSEFYYPGLLADILAHKERKPKQDILSKDRRQPQIRLESQPLAESQRTVHLKLGIAEAAPDAEHGQGSGVQDLRLFRNGLLVKTWSGNVLEGASTKTIEADVSIVAGENNFTAYAFNRDNIKSADSQISITGPERLRREGTAYLVVVGVGKYANSQYNLKYSVADATEIGEQLKTQQEFLRQYRPIEVVSLLNEAATKENILLALNLLAGTVKNPLPAGAPSDLSKIKTAQPEDAVIFFFSGHGTASGDRFYLVPHDLGYQGDRAKLDDVGLATILSHSVSDLELEDALKPVDVSQMLLVVDACYSGQILKANEERRGPMNTRGLAQLAYEKGMYVLTASQSDEVAFESAGLKHSYLTYALVKEGIKDGLADADHNAQIFLSEWFDYATERVPRIKGEKSLAGKELEEDLDPDDKRVQRPRVFNMREGGAERFIIARTTR
ncbi:MAG: caspase family protein [Acidobacteriota bacterium]